MLNNTQLKSIGESDDNETKVLFTGNTIREVQLFKLSPPYRLYHLAQRTEAYTLNTHAHDFYQIVIVLEGILELIQENITTPLKASQACVIPPGVTHKLFSPLGYTQIGIDIFTSFDERGIYRLLSNKFGGNEIGISTIDTEIDIDVLLKNMHDQSVLNTLIITNIMEKLILEICKMPNGATNSAFKEKFLELITSSCIYSLSLSQICKYMAMSKTQLELLTNEEFGCGAVAFLKRLRMSKACMLLQTTDLQIKDISNTLGFYDESHFNTSFKNNMCVTPRQYRNSARRKS